LNLIVESRAASNVQLSGNQTRVNANSGWNSNLRLYPSLKDVVSDKSRPLNNHNDEYKGEKIGFEHINQSIVDRTNNTISSSLVSSQSFDDIQTKQVNHHDVHTKDDCKPLQHESSRQRFKARARNRPSSPPLFNTCQPTQSMEYLTSDVPLVDNSLSSASSTNHRKKKRIPIPQVHLQASSSSSSSVSSTRASSQSLDDERRRQRDERLKVSIRLRRSQEIQRELDVLEQKRSELDKNYSIARQHFSKKT
jgi:hypothetical protein